MCDGHHVWLSQAASSSIRFALREAGAVLDVAPVIVTGGEAQRFEGRCDAAQLAGYVGNPRGSMTRLRRSRSRTANKCDAIIGCSRGPIP